MRYRSRYRRHVYRKKRNAGLSAALRHIEQAEKLTRELGGSDTDVKEYFYSIPPDQRNKIMDAYESQFGTTARQYADKTFTKWKHGKVHMSGLVASRLFSILPRFMPLRDKYSLTESLWRHVGPSSHQLLIFGSDASVEDIIKAIQKHIQKVISQYTIPTVLENRFNWLAAGDVSVKQELLNLLQQQEKQIVLKFAAVQIPQLLYHLQNDVEQYTQRMVQKIQVGKHKLDITFDRNSSGVRLENPSSYYRNTRSKQNADARQSSSTGHKKWMWWIGVISVLGYFMFIAD